MHRWFLWRGTAAGFLAGAGLVWALASGLFLGGMPVLAGALAERARGLLPLQVLGYIIVTFKFAAKPLGFWMTMTGVLTICTLAGGLWAARRPRRLWAVGLASAAAVAAVLWAVGGGPSLTYLSALYGASGMSDAEALATARRVVAVAVFGDALIAGGIFAAALWTLRRRAQAWPQPVAASPSATGVSRREFLARTIVMSGALSGAAMLVHWVTATTARAGAAVQSIFERVKGLPPEVTPNDKFYVVSKNPTGLDPKVDVKKWSLEITGLVGKPVRLTYEQILALPAVERYHTLECISNEIGGDLIGNARWKGVRFRDVLALAGGVTPKAIRFAIRCADGYSEGIPVMDAMHPDTMLAYEMNGERLPFNHGFPVRMLIPGLFGMKNPKWMTKIEAVSTHFTGYWQASGWSDEAIVKTMSVFRVPGQRTVTSNAAGEVDLGGVAYAGDRGIQGVEVSPDNGKTWFRAETRKALGQYTWVLWAAVWKPSGPGEYTLRVRAKDGQGILQTSQEAPTLPDGATGHHTIRIRVRRP